MFFRTHDEFPTTEPQQREARKTHRLRLKGRKRSRPKEKSEWTAKLDTARAEKARKQHKKLPKVKVPRTREVPRSGYFKLTAVDSFDRPDGRFLVIASARNGKPLGKELAATRAELESAVKLAQVFPIPVAYATDCRSMIYHLPPLHWRRLKDAIRRGTVLTVRDDKPSTRNRCAPAAAEKTVARRPDPFKQKMTAVAKEKSRFKSFADLAAALKK